jgi:hypothetical protein
VTGTFGTTLMIIAVAIAGARAMLHGSWGHFWSAIGGGAVLVCASWVVQTFLGAGLKMTEHKKRLLQALTKARAWLNDVAQRDVRVTPCACGQGGQAGSQPECGDLWDLIVALDTALQAIHIAETIARVDAPAGRIRGLGGNMADRDPCR